MTAHLSNQRMQKRCSARSWQNRAAMSIFIGHGRSCRKDRAAYLQQRQLHSAIHICLASSPT